MQITIEIDDQLLRDAMYVTGATTESAVVDAGLRLLMQTRRQAGIRQFRGKIDWEGDLQSSRRSRVNP